MEITTSDHKKPPFSVFLAMTVVIFFSALSAADSVGFVPNYIDGSSPPDAQAIASDTASDSLALADLPQLGETSPASATLSSGVLPSRIEIPAVGIDLPVQNPSTRDLDALDALLQKGPARHVDSGKLGESGNVIIFAHSSHLPIVHNKMFQAFNNIPDLTLGDLITLVGADGKSYLYSVDSVVRADVGDGGSAIDLSPSQGKKLTLVTCDTLTGKSARYVLTASFEGVVTQ